jgi:hypothetical protein
MMRVLHVSPGLRVDELARSLLRPTTTAVLVGAVMGMLAPAPMRAADGLSNGEVSPHSGTTATPFTFTVDYDRTQSPQAVTALLDGGNPITLELISGNPNNGTYGATTTLPAGTWTVSFEATAPSNPATSGPTLTVTTAGGSQTPAPTPMPTSTPVPTSTPGPTATATPTATTRPSSAPTPTTGATAPPPTTGGAPSPTPAGGVLGGGSSPGPTPEDGEAPAGTARATPAPSGGVSAGGTSHRAGASPAAAPNEPGEGPETAATERGRIPPAAIMLFVGGAISISGAATLGFLTLRARSRHARADDGAGT